MLLVNVLAGKGDKHLCLSIRDFKTAWYEVKPEIDLDWCMPHPGEIKRSWDTVCTVEVLEHRNGPVLTWKKPFQRRGAPGTCRLCNRGWEKMPLWSCHKCFCSLCPLHLKYPVNTRFPECWDDEDCFILPWHKEQKRARIY